MSSPDLGGLSRTEEGTFGIIDIISDANYVFLDVSVGLRICFSLRLLQLRGSRDQDRSPLGRQALSFRMSVPKAGGSNRHGMSSQEEAGAAPGGGHRSFFAAARWSEL